jgi:hypothetical protein
LIPGGQPLQKSRKKKEKREKKGGGFVLWFAIICYFLFVYFYYCYYPSAESYDSTIPPGAKGQKTGPRKPKAKGNKRQAPAIRGSGSCVPDC